MENTLSNNLKTNVNAFAEGFTKKTSPNILLYGVNNIVPKQEKEYDGNDIIKSCEKYLPFPIGAEVYVIDRHDPKMYHKDEISEYRIGKKSQYVILKEAGMFNLCKFNVLIFGDEIKLRRALYGDEEKVV